MDTSEPSAPVPEDPTDPLGHVPTDHLNPADPTPSEPPTAPIALGPVAGAWTPPPPPPPAPPMAPPAAGAGGGTWGPISTPYGLAWGPPPIPPVPAAPRSRSAFVAITAFFVVVSMLIGVGVGYAVWRPGTSTPTAAASGNAGSGSSNTPSGQGFSTPFGSGGSGTSGSGASGSGSGGVSDPSAVAAKVDPGLVDINVQLSYQQESAAGTGQVLTSSGEVLTNNHVIDGATSISVTDIGNGRTYSASVVGYDRTGDLAVIQLHGASGLSTVSIGDSSKVTVGESVVAIGNAGGVGGTPSVANGTVSSLNQGITASDDDGGNSENLTGLIEVNADVQPGDSGGPLVDSSGQVVGIDTAASESDTLSSVGDDGYAIPINTAITIAKQIEAGKSSSAVHIGPTAFLGVSVAPTISDCSGSGLGGLGGGLGGLGDGGSTASGAVVCGTASGSPADQAGLAEGDVITAIGGQTVTTPQSLSTIIADHVPGDSVSVSWQDADGNAHTATIQLASGPAT